MRARILSVTVLCFALLRCAGKGAVDLSLDFSTRPDWPFSFKLDISGDTGGPDSNRTFSIQAHGDLTGTGSSLDPSMISLKPGRMSVISDFLDSAETHNLKHQFLSTQATFSLKNTDIMPLHALEAPVISIGEWNLYTTLIKALPSLPSMNVRPGATWDRQRQFPLETNYGSATGHVFHHFIFDSLTTVAAGETHAVVSWTFTYTIQPLSGETDSLFKWYPLKGEGSGFAVVNISNSELVQTHAQFSVCDTAAQRSSIHWKEEIDVRALSRSNEKEGADAHVPR